MKTPNGSFDDIIHDIRLYKRSYMALWHENEKLKNKLQKEQKKKILKWWSKQNVYMREYLTPVGERGNFYDKLYPRIVVAYTQIKGRKLTEENMKDLRLYFEHP